MRTQVRDSSIDCHRRREVNGINGEQRRKIADYVKSQKSVTRKQIAKALGLDAATVSGQVKPLVDNGDLIETLERFPCPITGNCVHWLEHRDNQPGQRELPI